MTQNELVEAMRRLSPSQRAELSALAKSVVRDSRALPRAAAAHLSDPDPNLAGNAMSLLIDTEDLATVPMLEAPEPQDAYDRVARLTVAVDSQVELRRTIADRLKQMLDDKRPMNYEKGPIVEEATPQSRVCDEAYVLLRRLLNATEDREKQDSNARIFLRLPEARKDIEIRKARSSQRWTDLAGGGDE